MQVDIEGRVLRVVQGDLTRQDTDVVVNAANAELQHGGGVAAALARAAGPVLQEESERWVREHGALAEGQAAATSGGELPARWVVHVAGPVYADDESSAPKLQAAVRAALDKARELGATSVAMPAISAGVYGYPLEQAGQLIAATARAWLSGAADPVREVRLVGYDDDAVRSFEAGVSRADVGSEYEE